jgi:hypothetical protein
VRLSALLALASLPVLFCSSAQATCSTGACAGDPTPHPACEPIVRLTDCHTDSDCIVPNQIECCPCWMGGRQGAINRDKQVELSQQLDACCPDVTCLAVYLCAEQDPAAMCRDGTCALVSVRETPSPTPTPTAPSTGGCVGDCDDDGAVRINELILGVNMALGNVEVSACPSFQCVQDVEGVLVNCLLLAVNNALSGCASAIPTPTPTPCTIGQCVSPSYGCTGRACGPHGPSCLSDEFCDFSGRQCACLSPTPVLPHGHICCECANAACTDFAWVEVEPTCPLGCQTFRDAQCEAPCHGGPQGGPATCVSLTPCTTDAECDDGNACTVDRCTINGCTHDCVCE